MTRTMQFAVGLLSGASLIALSATVASADHYRKLSPKHTNYGVAQYNWTNVTTRTDVSVCVTLSNPVHDTQIAAVLMYQRPTEGFTTICITDTDATAAPFCINEDYLAEVFLGCFVVELSPNAALSVPNTDTNDWPVAGEDWPGCPGFELHHGNSSFARDSGSANLRGVPRTAETIWAPAEKVKVVGLFGRHRRADGLGGNTKGNAGSAASVWDLGHPGLFSLPPDAGDATAAIECVCGELGNLFADRDTFEKFGIDCP